METILIAEDEPEIRSFLGLALSCEGYDVEFAQNGEEAVNYLETGARQISVLLLDLIMPKKDGFQTLKEVRQAWPSLPVITISGICTPANVASVMKAGAVDFLSKPIGHGELIQAIHSALGPIDARRPAGVEEESVWNAASYLRSAGTWSESVESLLGRVANSDVPVLLRGETGVGKEVLARKLHEQSPRANQPFLKLNCAALPSELVESELFGYERGAFTGAFRTTPGKFEMANKGTILLDEIGDMDFKLQAKLLQVLQDREFLRLGAKDTSRVDIRVMAATHCSLEKAIEEGRFREDLYYRLNIVEIHVPPLRERKDEIIKLANFFLRKYAKGEPIELPMRLGRALLEHDWPGNVRELENVIRRFLVFRNAELISAELRQKTRTTLAIGSADYRTVTSEPLRPVFGGQPESRSVTAVPNGASEESTATTGTADAHRLSSNLAEVDQARKAAEIDLIINALNSTLWNRKQAAKLLNIDYKALLYKMKKLSIGGAGSQLPVSADRDFLPS